MPAACSTPPLPVSSYRPDSTKRAAPTRITAPAAALPPAIPPPTRTRNTAAQQRKNTPSTRLVSPTEPLTVVSPQGHAGDRLVAVGRRGHGGRAPRVAA